MSKNNTTYADAGVDIEAYEKAKDKFAKIIAAANAKSPLADCVVSGLGSFGAVFDTKKAAKKLGIKNYVEVESIDSVGTKVKIAAALGQYDTIGYDIVGHSCGDILAQGATPLVFGDYIAVDKVIPKHVVEIVRSLANACQEIGLVLHFGEVAEMPGVYQPGNFDLVGSIRGVVDLDHVITGQSIKDGDVLLGIASNGLHTSGYSLVRQVLLDSNAYQLDDQVKELGDNLGSVLLKPHTNYTKPLINLFPKNIIKGIAHITGGGLPGNLIRILPQDIKATIKLGSWERLPIFNLIQKTGRIADEEMLSTFNLGIGLVIVCANSDVEQISKEFSSHNINTYTIGAVSQGERTVEFDSAL